MNILEKHIAYLKNNPEGYWFKRKLYGYGWTPVRPQGWLVLVVFVSVMALNAYRFDFDASTESGVLINFLIQTLVLIFILILICYKTGEPPKWQWGIKDDGEEDVKK